MPPMTGHALALAVPLLMLAACSSSSSPVAPATGDAGGAGGCPTATVVTGTLGGQALSPAYAIALKGANDASYPNQITILISNASDYCSLLQTTGSLDKANARAIALVLGATRSDAPPVAAGTYTQMDTTNELTAGYQSLDAACRSTSSPWMGGSVVVCGAGASFTGSFDQTFGSDHATGTFDAALCVLSADAGSSGGDGGSCAP
jgi:hypothetical protein